MGVDLPMSPPSTSARPKSAGRTARPSRAQAPKPRPAGLTYKEAGVDIDAKMRAIQRIKGIARGTYRAGVLSEIGAFGGLFDLAAAGPFRRPAPPPGR